MLIALIFLRSSPAACLAGSRHLPTSIIWMLPEWVPLSSFTVMSAPLLLYFLSRSIQAYPRFASLPLSTRRLGRSIFAGRLESQLLQAIVSSTHARLDPDMAFMSPFNVRDLCNEMVWNEQRKSDFEHHEETMFHTAVRGLPRLALCSRNSSDRTVTFPNALCKAVLLCRTDTYLHCQDCVNETMIFSR